MRETVIVRNLDIIMKAKNASNIALAEKSGLSDRCINNARQGKRINKFSAVCILEALEKYTFGYKKRGPKK